MKLTPSTALLATLVAYTGVTIATPALGQSDRRDPKRIFDGFKRKFDKDLDGRVSKSEFTGRKKAWNRLDVDGDGWITLTDVQAWTRRNGKKGKQEEKGLKCFYHGQMATGIYFLILSI